MESNTTKIYRRTEEDWFQLIQECRTSGLSDKEWCRQNNITIRNFYHHIRQLTKKACQIPANKRTSSREHHEIVPLKGTHYLPLIFSQGTDDYLLTS